MCAGCKLQSLSCSDTSTIHIGINTREMSQTSFSPHAKLPTNSVARGNNCDCASWCSEGTQSFKSVTHRLACTSPTMQQWGGHANAAQGSSVNTMLRRQSSHANIVATNRLHRLQHRRRPSPSVPLDRPDPIPETACSSWCGTRLNPSSLCSHRDIGIGHAVVSMGYSHAGACQAAAPPSPSHAHNLQRRFKPLHATSRIHTSECQEPSFSQGADQSQAQQQQQEQVQPQTVQHWFDQLSETQRYVLADEWGFTQVGTSLPAGVPLQGILKALPLSVLLPDTMKAVGTLVGPLAVMAAAYGWLWYMHNITPWWQLVGCWMAIGTAYMGLFQVAQECARGAFLPQHPATQSVLGSILMAPSLFSLDAWRVMLFRHFMTVNQLGGDGPWQPLRLVDVAAAGPWRRKLQHLTSATPFKLLSSIGTWAQSWQAWDLFSYYFDLRKSVLLSWAAPALWMGLVLPIITACTGGLSGLFTYWLAPWLVFHMWFSTLNMLSHTAPHIPWRALQDYDLARAAISGTITVTMPAWLEKLLNHPNYHVPQHVAFNGMPCYQAKEATQVLREKLWPYMTEAPLSLKLVFNHITKWQVYDEVNERYITYEQALQLVDGTSHPIATDESAPDESSDSRPLPA